MVKRGETLSKIASKYGVTVADIKKWNKLKRNTIARGKKLKINSYERVATGKKKTPEVIAKAEEQAPNDSINVAAADSAAAPSTEIARAQPADAVKEQPQPQAQAPAKKATAAKAAPAKAAAPKVKYHTVKKGESLFRIAKKYKGVTVAHIQKLNGLTGSDIKIGQKFKIPRS